MNKLAITLPGGEVINPPSTPAQGSLKYFPDLASVLTPLLSIAFYIAIFLAFYYLVWGAFAYMMARGNKEDLAKARARITWALVGLLVVVMAFLIAQFAGQIFPPTKGGLPF